MALDVRRMRERLERRREELVERRGQLESSTQPLSQSQPELEEAAQSELLSRRSGRISEHRKAEIEAIDQALQRIELGDYGTCEVCGEPIEPARLEAVPWATRCLACMHEERGRGAGGGVTGAYAMPRGTATAIPPEPELEREADLSPREPALPPLDHIIDELEADGVEVDGLTLEGRDGVLRMTGTLPSELQHQKVIQLVERSLGLSAVVDRIRVERIPLPDGVQDREGEMDKTDADVALHGEDINQDVYRTLTGDEVLDPPDHIDPPDPEEEPGSAWRR